MAKKIRLDEENRKTKDSKCDKFIMMLKSSVKRFGLIKHSSGLCDGEKLLL